MFFYTRFFLITFRHMKWMRFFLPLLFPFVAGTQSLSFNVYTPADGLTDVRVQKIYQDKQGILYFLTRDGFSSFDGQRFRNFTHYQNQPLSVINDIIEDKNGRLMISALTGIYYLNKNKLSKDTLLFTSLAEPGSIIHIGKGEELILANSGIIVYDGLKTTPLYNIGGDGKKAPLVFDKVVGNNNWLIGTNITPGRNQYIVALYNRLTGKVVSEMISEKPFDIIQFHDTVYLLSNNSWVQLNNADLNNGKLTFQPLSFVGMIPDGNRVSHFYIDRRKNIWLFCEGKRTCVLNPEQKEIKYYTAATGFPESASSMFQDAENNYWFILTGKGVCKLVQSKVEKFSFSPAEPTKQIESINISPDGIITMKSRDTIHVLKDKLYFQELLKTKPGFLQVFSWNKKIWTLYNSGRIESNAGETIQFASFAAGTKQISPRLSFDNDGRLLIAGNYLTIINLDKTFITVELPYFSDNVVTDNENNYWCFARNGDIRKYKSENNKLKELWGYTDKSYSPRFAINWNKDTFCIGTRNNGIVFIKASNNKYAPINTLGIEKGLSNNFISDLIPLGNNKLLATTVAGLDIVHFNTTDTSVEQLFSRIGIFTGVSNAIRSNDSTIIALTDNGTPYLAHLKSQAHPNIRPSLFFDIISVNGSEVESDNYSEFAFNKNNFRFSVSAPSFVDEKNIRFIFRLEGPNTNVVQNSRSADFEYSNLLPGSYNLTVTAIFPGDNPVNKNITYSFTIKKPFWKTNSFRFITIILIGVFIYFLFNSLLRRKLLTQRIELEKQQAVAIERTRIATDMHDDLGAGISTIKYLSQSAPYIPLEQQKQNNIKIAEQADELVDKMNDIIWAMNEKNDTLDNLIFYIKGWLANYSQQHQLPSHFVLPATIPSTSIRGEKRQHIFLCVKESIHNIIKHADAKNIWLTVDISGNTLHITIRDDGKGFDLNKTFSGNGLSNMQKRMKMIEGEVHTETNNGTLQRFSVPL